MRSKIALLTILVIVFFGQVNLISAQTEFKTTSSVQYIINEQGNTLVKNSITLENLLSTVYAKSYSISLSGPSPEKITAYSQDKSIFTEITDDNDRSTIKILFDDSVVGKGQARQFTIEYELSGIATKTGEIWEISIPKLSSANQFDKYDITLVTPKSFGEAAYIAPDPTSTQTFTDTNTYSFTKRQVEKSSITAAFGKFQVFSFDLTYHLENPLSKTASTQIALPPDTAYQKLYYTQLNPPPNDIQTDPDGNWLATYELSPRQRVDVKAMGQAQLFAYPRPFPAPDSNTLANNLSPTAVWQTTDERISSLASSLNTPKDIYNYVVNTLSYDYDRVRPNSKRLGAVQTLANPSSAICMEYTDLFVTLSRASGIPAREVNGYAYSENPQIQPLSLVADVLHAWPEYWDDTKKVWTPVDPTWGSTTGGIDFFNKLDLRHFTFVNHGQDPEKPFPPGSYKLANNPQKDVFINFGQLPEIRFSTPEISTNTSKYAPFQDLKIGVELYNPGPSALENYTLGIYLDKQLHEERKLLILPYTTQKLTFSVPLGLLGINSPSLVQLDTPTDTITIRSPINQIILINLLIAVAALSAIMFFLLLKTGRLKIRFTETIIKNVKKS